MPALVVDGGLRSHHVASFAPGADAQLLSAARRGKALLVQVTAGTVYVGGPGVDALNGTPHATPAIFADMTGGGAWYAYLPAGSGAFVDEIY